MARISSASARDRASASARDKASTSVTYRTLPYHCISQSFDLPPATTSITHLTCPLPPHHQSKLALVLDIEHYHITASVSHLTCPLPPHQSVIWLAHCHHISQSFHLPSTTASLQYCITASVSHLTCPLPMYHCITTSPHQSVIWLSLTTTSVSHLTCPLLPHQSVIWLAHCHHICQSFDMPSTTASLHYYITVLLCHHVSQSFDLPTATTPVSHLTCPLLQHYCITTLPHQ